MISARTESRTEPAMSIMTAGGDGMSSSPVASATALRKKEPIMLPISPITDRSMGSRLCVVPMSSPSNMSTSS